MRLSARVSSEQFEARFTNWHTRAQQKMERAALIAVEKGARKAVLSIRSEMQGAGLGGLGNALADSSDKKRGGIQKRYSNGGFSASGVVFIRSRSERSRGAIRAYTEGANIRPVRARRLWIPTEGANIRPVRARWLWIPTDEIQRFAGSGRKKERLTPRNWTSSGMEAKVGSLTYIKSVNGYPLLIVQSTNVPLTGAKGKPRANLKNGRPPKGYTRKTFLVAFIGIPRTARAARINVPSIMSSVAAELPSLFYQALGRI
jgi:hypothetical protein